MMRARLLFIVMILFAGLGMRSAVAVESNPSLFVVITSAEPQTQAMAMVLSVQAVKKGATVHMLLCGPGGDLALKGAPQTVLEPRGATPQGLLQSLVQMGVEPVVCALYLPNKAKSPTDLLDGVGVATPEEIAEKMLAENTRLFTF